jgi:ribosome-binding factor A
MTQQENENERVKELSAAIVLLADGVSNSVFARALNDELSRRGVQLIRSQDVQHIHTYLSMLQTYKSYQENAIAAANNASTKLFF